MVRDNLKTQAEPAEVNKIMKFVDRYRGLVFDDNKVGFIRTKPIHLGYEEEFLITQGVITDVAMTA